MHRIKHLTFAKHDGLSDAPMTERERNTITALIASFFESMQFAITLTLAAAQQARTEADKVGVETLRALPRKRTEEFVEAYFPGAVIEFEEDAPEQAQ